VRRRTVLALALAVVVRAPALHAQQQVGGIVFVGSSIFHRWTALASQMAPLPVTNLAFDGSQTDDMLRTLHAGPAASSATRIRGVRQNSETGADKGTTRVT
jgi:hypothetical protein